MLIRKNSSKLNIPAFKPDNEKTNSGRLKRRNSISSTAIFKTTNLLSSIEDSSDKPTKTGTFGRTALKKLTTIEKTEKPNNQNLQTPLLKVDIIESDDSSNDLPFKSESVHRKRSGSGSVGSLKRTNSERLPKKK